MPIYQYQCGKCGSVEDYLLSSNTDGPDRCANDDCASKEGPFKRIWHGQTVSASSKYIDGNEMRISFPNGVVLEGGLVKHVEVDLPSVLKMHIRNYKFETKNR